MSRQGDDDTHPRRGFPRVSGDEPHVLAGAAAADGFSPRERG